MSEERKYCVYCHTNTVNGKKYIGLTKQSPNRRWRNGTGYSKQIIFNNAIQKYGWENFSHEILKNFLLREEAIEYEQHYINDLNTIVPYGYNSTFGGESFEASPELKKRMSESRKGKIPENIDELHCEEVRNKISKTLTGFVNPSCCIKIICDDMIFSSIFECERYYNVKTGSMSAWLNGKRPMPQTFYDIG